MGTAMAAWIAGLLFFAGLILCFIEILTPGFGVFALSGVVCIVGSIFLITPDLTMAIKYLVIILGVLLICTPFVLKRFSKSKFFERLMVRERLTTEEGYTAAKKGQEEYVGHTGIAATALRPSGVMELQDGTRLDVVTRGDFIEKGEPVKVIRKEGTWLVVEKKRSEDEWEES